MRGATHTATRFMLGLLFAALLFEGALRVFEIGPLWRVMPVIEASFYGPDAMAGYTLRPGASGFWIQEGRAHHTVNRHGMLDRDYDLEKPPGTIRIAILGDSFTEALQVEREATFIRLAEHRLMDTGLTVEAMNFGISGATAAVTAARMESLAALFDPDAYVVLMAAAQLERIGWTSDMQIVRYVKTDTGLIRRDRSFADTRGYAFRSGRMGRVSYWMMDNVRLVALLNSIKNRGLGRPGAERQAAPSASTQTCDASGDPRIAFWLSREPADRWAFVDAFLRDVTTTANGRPIFVLVGGMDALCPGGKQIRARLGDALGRLGSMLGVGADLHVIDFDAALESYLSDGAALKDMYGFGATQGRGHFSHLGHETVADMVTGYLSSHLQ